MKWIWKCNTIPQQNQYTNHSTSPIFFFIICLGIWVIIHKEYKKELFQYHPLELRHILPVAHKLSNPYNTDNT